MADAERPLSIVHVPRLRGEASAMLACANPAVLEAHDFERAFWTVLDEGPVEECLLLVGHKRERPLDRGWKAKHLSARVEGDARCTDDCESIARRSGWIYLLGSQFGAKSGPLEHERAFAARFREDALEGRVDEGEAVIEVARRPFRLHRAVNDALAAAGVELVPIGPHVRERYIERTLREGYGSEEVLDLRVEDSPINIEGMTLSDDGTLLLGLRFPVSAGGHPLVVRLDDVDALFRDDPTPIVAFEAELVGIGTRVRPVGLRGMQREPDGLHVLTGPIGSTDKPNAVAIDYPGSGRAACEHWRLEMPPAGSGSRELGAELVRRLPVPRVEGLARQDGSWHYALDEERRLALLVEDGAPPGERP